jgi:hypothetical protein
MPDKAAEARWARLAISLDHYTKYLAAKPAKARFSLSVLDLLFIRNFKAGNASVTEPPDSLKLKLRAYGSALRAIHQAFPSRALRTLAAKELSALIKLGDRTLKLAGDPSTSIAGFGPSYVSALLAAFFPRLLPVLDRRVLNGADILVELTSQNQVIRIQEHYGTLIRKSHQVLQAEPNLELRELDRRWFTVPLGRLVRQSS